jgi:peptidoglycan/xylan/chitin deacetylase (PgdA/CDA1 family)
VAAQANGGRAICFFYSPAWDQFERLERPPFSASRGETAPGEDRTAGTRTAAVGSAVFLGMTTLSQRSRSQALRAIRVAGGFRWIRDSRWRGRRLLILGYHGVALEDEHEWNSALYISQPRLESQLRMLRSAGCTVLPLGEALGAIEDGTLPPRSVAITFDDGNHDFHERAFPILQSFGLPVMVYLTTYYCDYEAPVFRPTCNYLLWKGRNRTVALTDSTGSNESFDLRTSDGRTRAFAALHQLADRERYSGADKQRMVERLAAALRIDIGRLMARRILQIMRPSSVQQLAAAGVDFQLHTHRHRAPLHRDQFMSEIKENRSRIQQLTGKRPSHFCYPSGNYRAEFLTWLEEEQVVSGVTCDPGLVNAKSHRLLLPRFVAAEGVSPLVFEAWLTGAADWLPRRRTHAYR